MNRIEAGALDIRKSQDRINKKEEKRALERNEALLAAQQAWAKEVGAIYAAHPQTAAQVEIRTLRNRLWAESVSLVEMQKLQTEIDFIEDRCATLNTQEERDEVREMGRKIEVRLVALSRRVDEWRVIAGARWFCARGAWPSSQTEAQDWGLRAGGWTLDAPVGGLFPVP